MMFKAMKLAIAVVGAALLVGACAGSREAPIKGTYLLEPALPTAARTQPGSLRIAPITVAVPYRGRSFVYRESDLKFVSDYYEEFLVGPGPMITEATMRALAAAKVFASVGASGQLGDGTYTLDGFVTSLYGDSRIAGKPSAVLEITFYLTRGYEGSPFWTREYARRIAVSGSSPAAYAAAQNTALTEILAELARDLAAIDLTRPG
jgi:uncharacterized lipoprotein YmbA